jgi:carnitine O-acetyltransferase
VKTKQDRNGWRRHNLKASLRACEADVALYLKRWAALRFKFVCWLFSITTLGPQKRLAGQIDAGHCDARAEGIKRLYLGGRSSVAFHNHFPIVLNVPAAIEGSCIAVSAALISSLHSIIQSQPRHALFSNAIASARVPARFCDDLYNPNVTTQPTQETPAQHFALLYQGQVFSITLTVASDVTMLMAALNEILAPRINPSAPSKKLGELTVLPRAQWHQHHASIIADKESNSAAIAALNALKDAAFLVCLDSDTKPRSLTDIGNAVRYQNIANRYFDKCVQFIVFGNGECGYLCDHSVIDGVEAMTLAEHICEAMTSAANEQSVASVALANYAKNPSFSPPFKEYRYELPVSHFGKNTLFFKHEFDKIYHTSLELPTFDSAYFAKQPYPADSLIQLAIQLCFFRCKGYMPSVFEPVSLSHLKGGRIDFISPVSIASKNLVAAIKNKADAPQIASLLGLAITHHRKEIHLAKKGLGHLGHLLALSALEVPNHRRLGAAWIGLKETLFSAVDAGSSLLTKRDVVASNGGKGVNDSVKLFGTMSHRNHAFAIGYIIGVNGLTINIQANGKYVQHGSIFSKEFQNALQTIANICQPHK